jgi:hypothetical protein
MKPPGSTLQSLYAQLYPVEERKRRAALAVRFILLLWFAAGIYNSIVVFAMRFPEPARRMLVAAGFGLIGPAVVHLPLPARFATTGLEIGSRVIAGLLLLLVVRLLHPSATIQTEIEDQAQRHAATQGREHPAQIARRLAGQAPGVPLVRVGRQLIGVPYGADLGHIAVIAPTRSGKGLHLTQTLLTWPGAAVVVDPKGEQWQRTASWRASNIGPVYCLPPAGIDLLNYFSLDDSLDTQELHQHLIRPWQDKDPVFAEKCLVLFTAAAQVGTATDTHALRVLGGWADQRAHSVLQAAYPHTRPAIDRFLDGDDPARPNRFALTAWGIFSSRIGPLVPHLNTWTTPTVPRDWAARKATIYLCYPLQQLTAAGPLLSALLAALLRGQIAQTTRRPTLFAIDELPAVGLHNLAEYLATVGSSGVTVLFYAQALTQLAAVYGEAGAQTILGNCHHQLYYPPRDLATAEQISAVFGTTLAVTRSGGRGTRGARESVHEAVRAALEPAQALALPEAAVVALTLLGGRQYRLIGQRLDPRRTFAHLQRAPRASL